MVTVTYSSPPKKMLFPDVDFIRIVVIVISAGLLIPIPFFMIYYYIKFSRISQVLILFHLTHFTYSLREYSFLGF